MPTWKIKTKDGKTIEGDDSPFSLVDVNDISEFTYIPKGICIVLKPGQRLIYFKRHRQQLIMNSTTPTERTTNIFVGFQETKNGTNFKTITEITHDGKMIQRDNDGRAD